MFSFRRWTAGALATAVVCALSLPALAAPPANGEKSGDWIFQCRGDANGAQECRATQTEVTKTPDGKTEPVLRAVVGRMPDKTLVFFAVVPLGIAIPAGVAFKVDESKQTMMSIEQCTPVGCEAAIKLDAKLLDQFKKGQVLKVGFMIRGKTLVVPISLKGFSGAVGRL